MFAAPILLLACPLSFAAQGDSGWAPPNVLVFLADDFGVDMLGSYAGAYPGLALQPCTPNLDRLAAAGVRFTNAWSDPVCSPTRTQLLTGKQGRRTGVGRTTDVNPAFPANHGLQAAELTLPKLLAGHANAAVGKWHAGDPFQDGPLFLHPLRVGFQSFAGSLYGIEGAFDHWEKTVVLPGQSLPGYSVHATTDLMQDAIDRVTTLPEPWFVLVEHHATHAPFHCPGEHGFDLSDCQASPCGQQWCQDCTSLTAQPLCAAAGVKACQARAMAHAMDSAIGRILQHVDLTNTLVVFLGDNGTSPLVSVPPFSPAHAKGTLYQGGINVPLIVRGPGVAPGVSHELVGAVDLFATLAELVGVQPPPDPQRDSVSFAAQLGLPGAGGTPRQFLYAEYFEPNFVPDAAGEPPPGYLAQVHQRALRNASFKLIERRAWDPLQGACSSSVELYRLADTPPQDPALGPDPFEQHDLMLSQASWSIEEQSAFAELVLELELGHPPLPTGCP